MKSFAFNKLFLARKSVPKSVGLEAFSSKGGIAEAFKTRFIRWDSSRGKTGSFSSCSSIVHSKFLSTDSGSELVLYSCNGSCSWGLLALS